MGETVELLSPLSSQIGRVTCQGVIIGSIADVYEDRGDDDYDRKSYVMLLLNPYGYNPAQSLVYGWHDFGVHKAQIEPYCKNKERGLKLLSPPEVYRQLIVEVGEMEQSKKFLRRFKKLTNGRPTK